jgi:biofilm PGA synthesis lipoprotein PgaB
MRALLRRLALAGLAALGPAIGAPAAAPAPPRLLVLSYHDVADADPDQTFVAVTTDRLIGQLEWLRADGWSFVSVDRILAARDGGAPLPDRSVLLTFDDGYASHAARVLPILRAFEAPAVFAIVSRWIDDGGETVDFGGKKVPRSLFMTWDQVRELAASPLVEIASHSNDQHFGIPGNPQGNLQPALVTRRYADGRYETDAEFDARVRADLATSDARLRRELGRAPRVMVWPYGADNDRAITIAGETGMPITFTLDEGFATVEALRAMPRHLIENDPPLDRLVAAVRRVGRPGPLRVVHLDLDYVHDPDPARTNENLGRVVQRVADLGVNAVFLQAYADPAGDGLVREVYFPNRELPVRADLFNRAAWQLRTRARVEVYAWMPVLAWDLPGVARVERLGGGVAPGQYRRLSPFDPEARRRIRSLYEDLARHANFAGLLFHDDALLSDFEDASPAALAAYRAAGFPADVAAIRADPATMARWTRFKSRALTDFTRELTDAARVFRAPLRTARNLYARVLVEPTSEEWFAQNLDDFLAAYDWTAVMAMPLMEEVPAGERDAWLRRLVGEVARRPGALSRTVFELQAVDWRRPAGDALRPVPSATLARQMRLLAREGAVSFGYYPDDFAAAHPDVEALAPALSLRWFPFR